MTILCYHTVEPGWVAPLAIEPADFRAHARWLATHRRVVDLTVALQHSARGRVALTFDDALDGVHAHAFEALVANRLPPTVFVVASTLTEGRPVDWVDIPPPRPVRAMTLEEIQQMRDAG